MKKISKFKKEEIMDTSKQYIKMCDCPEIQEQKPRGNEFTISYKNPDIWIEHEGSFLYAKHDVWLPRQDQIQKMIGKSESCFCIYQIKDGWGGEIIQDREHVFYVAVSSPEQVWLAFYFHEKHQKVWSSKEEKWVKK